MLAPRRECSRRDKQCCMILAIPRTLYCQSLFNSGCFEAVREPWQGPLCGPHVGCAVRYARYRQLGRLNDGHLQRQQKKWAKTARTLCCVNRESSRRFLSRPTTCAYRVEAAKTGARVRVEPAALLKDGNSDLRMPPTGIAVAPVVVVRRVLQPFAPVWDAASDRQFIKLDQRKMTPELSILKQPSRLDSDDRCQIGFPDDGGTK